MFHVQVRWANSPLSCKNLGMKEQATEATVAGITLFICESAVLWDGSGWREGKRTYLPWWAELTKRKETYFLRDTNGGGIAKVLHVYSQGIWSWQVLPQVTWPARLNGIFFASACCICGMDQVRKPISKAFVESVLLDLTWQAISYITGLHGILHRSKVFDNSRAFCGQVDFALPWMGSPSVIFVPCLQKAQEEKVQERGIPCAMIQPCAAKLSLWTSWLFMSAETNTTSTKLGFLKLTKLHLLPLVMTVRGTKRTQTIARKTIISIAILHYLCIKSSQGELEMGWMVIQEIMECHYINQ